MIKYKFLSHTADIKFQSFGSSLEESFENSAIAFREIITKDKIEANVEKSIKVKGVDLKQLLMNFLEEFLFLLDSENLILSKIKDIKISGVGNKLNKRKYELKCIALFDNIHKYLTIGEVKAITYSEMFIKNENNKFVVQVVVDV